MKRVGVCSLCSAVRSLILGTGVTICLWCDYSRADKAGPPIPPARIKDMK
jgi:hypothetical protein